MSTITIPLPDEDLAFRRDFAEASGTSAEALLTRQARGLREQLQRPPHPDVATARGIIACDVDGREAHRAHLEKKRGG